MYVNIQVFCPVYDCVTSYSMIILPGRYVTNFMKCTYSVSWEFSTAVSSEYVSTVVYIALTAYELSLVPVEATSKPDSSNLQVQT